MSVLIKGMEMPMNCTRCPCSNDESRFCMAANEYIPMLGKPNFCPLSEMPDVDSLNVQIAYIKGKTDGIKECTEKLHKARMEFAERWEDGQTT